MTATSAQSKDLDSLFTTCIQRQFTNPDIASVRKTCSRLANACTYSGATFAASKHWIDAFKEHHKHLTAGKATEEAAQKPDKKAKKAAKKAKKQAKKQAKRQAKKDKRATEKEAKKGTKKMSKKEKKKAKKKAKKEKKHHKKHGKNEPGKKDKKQSKKLLKEEAGLEKKQSKLADKARSLLDKQTAKEGATSPTEVAQRFRTIKESLQARDKSISRFAACLAFVPEDKQKDAIDAQCIALKRASESAYLAEECWARYVHIIAQCKAQTKKKKKKSCYKSLGDLDKSCGALAKKSEDYLKAVFSQKEGQLA